ncbi:MAG: DUF1343 domain-containing protein, partial [Verrucomicrobiae bacterium]|nr:DUF1343 domain-containing protein [Verrucomicrobiae bacterium]
TGLTWVNPSPNMRSPTEAMLYPGVGLLEFCAVSVGRGTETPFEIVGAPYVKDESSLAAELNGLGLGGVRFDPVRFTPEVSVFEGESCGGVKIRLTDPAKLRPLDLGIALAKVFYLRYPDSLKLREKFNTLLKHSPTLEAVAEGKPMGEIRTLWEPALTDFKTRRAPYLLYP